MSDWTRFRDELLTENPDTAREYEALGPSYRAIADVIKLRKYRGLSQEQLAKLMGKQQPAIARLEAGGVRPSITFLEEVATALGGRLIIRIEKADAVTVKRPRRRAAPILSAANLAVPRERSVRVRK